VGEVGETLVGWEMGDCGDFPRGFFAAASAAILMGTGTFFFSGFFCK